jgi:hypothetical protein
MGFQSCALANGASSKKIIDANFARDAMCPRCQFNSNRAARPEQRTVQCSFELASQNTRARRSDCRAGPCK